MILNVKNLTHGFGDRAIFDNVSFRLLKGEHDLLRPLVEIILVGLRKSRAD